MIITESLVDKLKMLTTTALVLLANTSGPSLAQGVPNAGALFSGVCMASAPTFEDFDSRAEDVGFRYEGEALLLQADPSIDVIVVGNSETCICLMTFPAGDPTSFVSEMFSGLVNDFANEFVAPESGVGNMNDSVFQFQGINVRLQLIPAQIDGAWRVGAKLIVPRGCTL